MILSASSTLTVSGTIGALALIGTDTVGFVSASVDTCVIEASATETGFGLSEAADTIVVSDSDLTDVLLNAACAS